MKFQVPYSFDGAVIVEAKDEEDAVEQVAEMSEKDLLDDAELTIHPHEISEE